MSGKEASGGAVQEGARARAWAWGSVKGDDGRKLEFASHAGFVESICATDRRMAKARTQSIASTRPASVAHLFLDAGNAELVVPRPDLTSITYRVVFACLLVPLFFRASNGFPHRTRLGPNRDSVGHARS
ncbi:hypothetical protein ANO11243_068610 [Dothideomycetidae sp. 11243]|nr:hypothetical protein ANO11243_068610 [fungal sp. No.11243]